MSWADRPAGVGERPVMKGADYVPRPSEPHQPPTDAPQPMARTPMHVNVTLAAEVQVLRLEPGDVLVVKMDHQITHLEEECALSALKTVWPDNKVIITSNMDFEVVR